MHLQIFVWKKGMAENDELKGVVWHWQSIDGMVMKAHLAQEFVGADPTDRAKYGLACNRAARLKLAGPVN